MSDAKDAPGGGFSRRALLGGGLVAGASLLTSSAGAQESSWDTSPGKHVLRHGLRGVKIGVATDPRGPTGCTVIEFPQRALVAVDLRGGAPVVSGPDVVRERGGPLDALCFAGGSLYGLGAADGVARELFRRRKSATAYDEIALVAGAVIYDFGLRETTTLPDGAAGRAALLAAREGLVPLGGRGAGAGASVGKWFPRLQPEAAGQGAAYREASQTQVLVLSVVNALGAIVDRRGKVVRGHRDPRSGARRAVSGAELAPPRKGAEPPRGNTTLTVVLTNRALSAAALRQLAKEVHTSMARAIHPFHGLSDGDVLYAASVGRVEDPRVNAYQLAAMASECAWDAVLSSFSGR